jgi:hypothetical protein
MIFAFGARRSGTFWLQRILTAHPEVAAVPSETYLFEYGIRPLLGCFHHGTRSSTTVGKVYADREALLDATRDFCDRMLAPFLEPGARYLSERSPGHAKAVDVIAPVYPDARLIHIIRDGRDVARSLVARSWGPDSVAEAAREWRDSILQAREHAPEGRYLEVGYELLLGDLEGGIRALYSWLELPCDDATLQGALAVAHRPINEDPNNPRIGSGKWRETFGEAELEAFEAEAGELMESLGYQREASQAAPAAPPAAQPATGPAPRRSLVTRVRGRLARRPPPQQPAAPKQEIGGALAVSQLIADTLLAALHQADRAALEAQLWDDVTLRLVGGGPEQTVVGRDAVADALVADGAWRSEQVFGQGHPGNPTFTLALGYAQDGTRAWRILCMQQRQKQIRALTLYRLGA